MDHCSTTPPTPPAPETGQPAPAIHPQNLQQLDRMAGLGLMAAGVAHEIKNCLVAVHTFAEIMAEKSEHQEMAALMRRELNRIDTLATQMLRRAAPPSAAQTWLPLHRLLDHSLQLLDSQMQQQRIHLQRDYRAESTTLCGDESQLQQVLLNLLLNAIEAMKDGGSLIVRTENLTSQTGERQIQVHVTDNGVGIAPKHVPQLFNLFFTTKDNGTGLGLPICQRIIQAHRGRLEVQSRLGHGSTFTLTLPVA